MAASRNLAHLRQYLRSTITVILLTQEGSRPRRFSFPRGVLAGLLVPVASVILLLLVVAVWSGTLLHDARQARELRLEVLRLREENGKVAALKAELDELSRAQSRVLEWAGIGGAGDSAASRLGETPLARPAGGPAPPVSSGDDRPETERRTDRLPAVRAGWAWPVNGWISRDFVSASGQAGHTGLDIVVPRGTTVTAAAEGTVAFAGWDEELGNLVVLEHGGGVTSSYGHNTELLVAQGDHVAAGQAIARAGSTGRSSAPHLHFEVRLRGTPLDPEAFLSQR